MLFFFFYEKKKSGVSKKTVLHNINRIFTACFVDKVPTSIFFARSLEPAKPTPPTVIVITDTVMGGVYTYDSLNLVAKALGVKQFNGVNLGAHRLYKKR